MRLKGDKSRKEERKEGKWREEKRRIEVHNKKGSKVRQDRTRHKGVKGCKKGLCWIQEELRLEGLGLFQGYTS